VSIIISTLVVLTSIHMGILLFDHVWIHIDSSVAINWVVFIWS